MRFIARPYTSRHSICWGVVMNIRNYLAGLLLLANAAAAQAVYIVNITESGSDVVIAGSGSFDLSGMTPTAGITVRCDVNGELRDFRVCTGDGAATMPIYMTAIAPSISGLTTAVLTGSGSVGPSVLMNGAAFAVPSGYVSGANISSSSTFANQTLVGLGIPVGTSRTYTLTSGDTIVFNFGPIPPVAPAATASIPTLSEWGVMIMSAALALFGLARIRRRH